MAGKWLKTALFGVLVALAPAHGGFAQNTGFLNNGVTAHRGNSSAYPENTMAAIRSALEAGGDWIEIDVYTTKDGRLAVIHDPDTARVGGTVVKVADVTYDELAKVDVAFGFREEKKLDFRNCPRAKAPLLEEAIDLIMTQNRTRLSIQPKDNSVKAAVRLVREKRAQKWIGFNDSDLAKMQLVKKLDKSLPVFWDRPADRDISMDIRLARRFKFESIVINADGITKGKIELIHREGLEAGAWTVNEEAAMRELQQLGVDRIYTDYPYRLLRIRKDMGL